MKNGICFCEWYECNANEILPEDCPFVDEHGNTNVNGISFEITLDEYLDYGGALPDNYDPNRVSYWFYRCFECGTLWHLSLAHAECSQHDYYYSGEVDGQPFHECTDCYQGTGYCTLVDGVCSYCGHSVNSVNNENTVAMADIAGENTVKDATITVVYADTSAFSEYMTNYTKEEIAADKNLFELGEINASSKIYHGHYVVGRLEGTKLIITRNGEDSDGLLSTVSGVTNFKEITEIVIMPGVEVIQKDAFYNCYSLKSIELPNTLTEIERIAFRDCSSLETIEIPDSVRYMGYGVFMGCTALKSVKLSDGMTTIPNSAFFNCSSLESVDMQNGIEVIELQAFVNCRLLKDVKFSENLTFIGCGAFSNCENLTSLNLPSLFATFDKFAIQSCTKLNTINFGGTKAEWENVRKLNNWNKDTGSYTIKCSDGNITK